MSFSPKLLAVVSGLLFAGTAVFSACRSAPVENRTPLGEPLPTVRGQSLADEAFTLPDDLAGAPAILLLGYDMDAQFDADRWLFGLLQAETPVRVLEVPTIPGLVPSWFGERIDEGMRSGIPKEDWGVVVTVYGAPGKKIVAFTGNENPRNIRVLLLGSDGVVRWFHDRGFSAGKLLELDAAARAML